MSSFHRKPVILLVDDDSRLAALAGDWLERHGFSVDYASSGADGLRLAADQQFDAIILDIEMPDVGGITVCRRLRERSNPTTPVIMLTGHTALDIKLQSLDAGADDCMSKPFAPEELAARVHALMRRHRHEVAPETIEIDGIVIDEANSLVIRDGKNMSVLPIGASILATLMRAYPRVVTRDELLRKVWGAALPESDSLRSHLYQLRRAVNFGFDEPLVETIAGVGLRFRAPRKGERITTRSSGTGERLEVSNTSQH